MSNCYPQRNLKTGQIQKSLCEDCINNLKIKYHKTTAFWCDDLMEASRDIENNKVFEHEQNCIYLSISDYDQRCIIVTKCNQYSSNKNMPEKTSQVSQIISFKEN
jgi:hypothetical protein